MKIKWREFLSEYVNTEVTKFDIFFCKTSFFHNGHLMFKACEMQIKYTLFEDGEWYPGDEIIYPELITADDRDNNFMTYIIDNTPEYDDAQLDDGWSNLGEMNFEETVKMLEEMKSLDYNLICDSEKNDIIYFSSSKIKSAISQNSYNKEFYDNGKVKKEGLLEKGIKIGLWKTYYENGNIETERFYENGVENGKAKGWAKTGELEFIADKKDNLPHGLVINYHKNGKSRIEASYNMGKEHGSIKKYFENGQLAMEGKFEEGKEEGTFLYFYKNGTLKEQIIYKNGVETLVNKFNEKGDFEINNNSKNLSAEEEKLLFCYPNLRGIDYSKVKFGPSGNPDTAAGYFASDINGDWYFSTSQMAMIFKAFSKEKLETELKLLLDKNLINYGDVIQKNGFKAWEGDGFQIEHTLIENNDIIVITNENISPVGSNELLETNLAPEVTLPHGYKNIGIKHVYDGEEFLKANHGKISLNIALLFNDSEPPNSKENPLNYIIIGVTTLPLAKEIIDNIIEKNYGKSNFEKLDDKNGWEYLHRNKFFFVGFLPKYLCVRINMLHNLKKIGK